MIPYIVIAGFFLLATANKQPILNTPQELAEHTKCQPDKISYWIGSMIEYVPQGRTWDNAELCMTRQHGDCKCRSMIAKETLDRCAGYEARIVKGYSADGNHHAFVLFTDHAGKRGFIDGGDSGTFPAGTNWEDIVSANNWLWPWDIYSGI